MSGNSPAPPPEQAAYEAFYTTIGGGMPDWPPIGGRLFAEAWEAAAQAAIRCNGEIESTAALNAIRASRHSLTEGVAELVTEGNELRAALGAVRRALVRDVNDRAVIDRAVAVINRVTRKPVSEEPAVVTAGTEHLAEQIRGLAIPDEL